MKNGMFVHWPNLAEALVALFLSLFIHHSFQQHRFSTDKLKRMVGILKSFSLSIWKLLYQHFDSMGTDCPITFELLESAAWRKLEEKQKIDVLTDLCEGKLPNASKAIEYCKVLPGTLYFLFHNSLTIQQEDWQ
jgi:hypothetical protein